MTLSVFPFLVIEGAVHQLFTQKHGKEKPSLTDPSLMTIIGYF
jgi:hypothetical protein